MRMRAVVELPEWERLPDIGLYMDQVVTLMERTFRPDLCTGEITKSMVNNYVKVGLLARPVGRKYDREHLARLMMIGVLKQALSMESIAKTLDCLCAQGDERGYALFVESVAQMSRELASGEWTRCGTEDSPQAQAVRAGIRAAVYTIDARRKLQALEAQKTEKLPVSR